MIINNLPRGSNILPPDSSIEGWSYEEHYGSVDAYLQKETSILKSPEHYMDFRSQLIDYLIKKVSSNPKIKDIEALLNIYMIEETTGEYQYRGFRPCDFRIFPKPMTLEELAIAYDIPWSKDSSWSLMDLFFRRRDGASDAHDTHTKVIIRYVHAWLKAFIGSRGFFGILKFRDIESMNKYFYIRYPRGFYPDIYLWRHSFRTIEDSEGPLITP